MKNTGKMKPARAGKFEFEKIPSGIKGLDEITGGGLPKGRPALVSGGPGCGKTLFAMEFIARGITDYNEPGVFIAFEEKIDDLKKNFNSLGFDLEDLVRRRRNWSSTTSPSTGPRSRRPVSTISKVYLSGSAR